MGGPAHTAAMPLRWVTRRDVNGREDALPVRCFVEGAVVAEPGLRTVGQCISSLLRDGEQCDDDKSNQRPIKKDGRLVGYIDITR